MQAVTLANGRPVLKPSRQSDPWRSYCIWLLYDNGAKDLYSGAKFVASVCKRSSNSRSCAKTTDGEITRKYSPEPSGFNPRKPVMILYLGPHGQSEFPYVFTPGVLATVVVHRPRAPESKRSSARVWVEPLTSASPRIVGTAPSSRRHSVSIIEEIGGVFFY